ncbi:hypothetical protein P9112_006517 [Eukaryota sp. TZLM1-RC]
MTDPASSFLDHLLKHEVLVRLTTGDEIRGVLSTIDSASNVYLQKCSEYSNGDLVQTYEDVLVRGINVQFISLP